MNALEKIADAIDAVNTFIGRSLSWVMVPVVAVSFVSRMELFGAREPDSAPEGEVRFRNPGHPAARVAALAPSVVSSE